MTNEEAIDIVKCLAYHDVRPSEEEISAAIAALKAEPCGDTISRRAMLDGLASIAKAKAKSDAQKSLMGRAMFFTEQLPPVTPKITECEHMVSREAVLEAVKNNYRMAAIDVIEKLPPVTPKPRWIPVSERLPEADEYVGNVAKYYLVQNEYRDIFVARYTHSGYWEQIYQLKPCADEIVAWKPLPEPYKEGESE